MPVLALNESHLGTNISSKDLFMLCPTCLFLGCDGTDHQMLRLRTGWPKSFDQCESFMDDCAVGIPSSQNIPYPTPDPTPNPETPSPSTSISTNESSTTEDPSHHGTVQPHNISSNSSAQDELWFNQVILCKFCLFKCNISSFCIFGFVLGIIN